MRRTVGAFLCNETGSVSLWNLVWLMVFFLFTGLAVDSSNAFRVKAMMQATADAAAHAAALDLPDTSRGTASALSIASANMPVARHGAVVKPENVVHGHWSGTGFTPLGGVPKTGDEDGDEGGEGGHVGSGSASGVLPVNAVQVIARRTRETLNPLSTQILGMFGFTAWDINASAVVVAGANRCFLDGMVAQDYIDISNGNVAGGTMCFHAQRELAQKKYGIEVGPGNTFRCGVQISTPVKEHIAESQQYPFGSVDPSGVSCSEAQFSAQEASGSWAPTPTGGASSAGLFEAASTQTFPQIGTEICSQVNIMLDHFGLPAEFSDPECATSDRPANEFPIVPDWMSGLAAVNTYTGGGNGGGNSKPKKKDEEADDGDGSGLACSDSTVIGGTRAEFEALDLSDSSCRDKLFHVACNGNGKLTLSGDLTRIGLVTDCQVDLSKTDGEMTLSDVVIVSTYRSNGGADKTAISIAQDTTLGTASCGDVGGGVRLLALEEISAPAQIAYHGVQMVTPSSVELAAQQDGNTASAGLSVLAGDHITFTSNSSFSNCGEPNVNAGLFTRVYRLAL